MWGFFADTKGRRRVLWSTLLAAFVSTVFSSFAHNFWTMVLLRFVNGFFVSSTAVIYAYLGEFHSPKTRSRAIMCSGVIYSVVGMLLPIIAYLVINQDWVLSLTFLRISYRPWRVFLIVCGVPGLLCSLIIYILPESPKFLLTVGEETKAIQVLQKMHRWNNGKETLKITHILPDDDTSIIISKLNHCDSNSNFALVFLLTMWNQTAPLFERKYLKMTVIICNIQFWALVAANGLYMWFPQTINSVAAFIQEHPGEHKHICEIVYDQQESLYKTDGTIECLNKLETPTFYYSLIMNILYASSFALVGFIINRVGKIYILFITIIFFTSCGLASVFIVNSVIAAYLYVLFFVVGVAIIVLNVITVELYPTHLRAMATCISLMVGRVGSIAGANVAGVLMGQHCEWNFYICCGALFICAFLALLLPRKNVHGAS
nr:synaptic vesicle glycoprotein 2B-like [Bactrocera oleae]